MNRSEHRAKILAYLAKHPDKGYKSHQLRRSLAISSDHEFQAFRDVLHTMVDDGELLWTKKRGYHKANKKAKGIVGTLKMTKQGTGFVTTESGDTIAVDKRSVGTALDGDTVTVALFAVKKGKARSAEPPEGEVTGVVKRNNITFIGTLERSKNFYFVLPDNAMMPRDIYIPNDKLNGAEPGEKVVVELTSWDDEHRNPEGKVLEVFGKAGDPFVEVRSVIEEFRLPTAFPPAVTAEVAAIGKAIPPEEIARRLDLRRTTIVTIDPFDAKDFDDALSIEQLPDGSMKLGVHIADVSAYVREGTEVDREAYHRGTSVYLANQVIPMLPERLSNELCSLMPHVDRLAYTCFITVNRAGEIKHSSFARSIINSKRRFTYEEVEQILDKGKGEYHRELSSLWALASQLRKKRMKHGSVDFDSPEAKFRYDVAGKPVEIMIKKRLKSHQLVEECMLLANRTVAEYVAGLETRNETAPFVYRIHDSPDPEKLKNLATFVRQFGHTFNIKEKASSKELQRLLLEVQDTKEENVITEVALRSMAKAVYSPENIGHFGLGFSHYTHFTSPIRRYPDLLVHRMLFEYTNGMKESKRPLLERQLPEWCRHCSDRERVATEAERNTVKVMQVEYMQQHVGDNFEGIVSGVTQFGIFIEINDLLVEGLLHIRDLDDDYYRYDDRQYALIGDRTGKRYRLGDSITVTVAKVSPERRQIDFVLTEDDITRKRGGSDRRKKRRH